MSGSVSTRTRTVRATQPFSPDVKLGVRSNKKKHRKTQPKLRPCIKCSKSSRLPHKSLCAVCMEVCADPQFQANVKQTQLEEKKRYLDEAQAFAADLAKSINNPAAERLYCPVFRTPHGGCGCMQKYLVGTDDGTHNRARILLQLLQEAKRLAQQKCYNWSDAKCRRGGQSVGLGNGQKRSSSFELFVAEHRPRLRDLQLCERATQRVLFYSNNFLHRVLKTEPNKGQRIQRTKGKAALGLLQPIEELPSEACCRRRCTALARQYRTLVQQWRDRSQMGQMETRRVLAEMLTPCAATATNCYKFISWVTGCSFTTISRVSRQMQETGGDRDPPEHGLKKLFQSKNLPEEGDEQTSTLHDIT
ncbi:uncharacterized protein LOC135390855 [Ornithodoros turicata]